MAKVVTVFQASDLNRQWRTVLDAARSGQARVRDQDGFSFLVLPEHRVQAFLAVVRAAANLAKVEHALTTGQVPLSLPDYGEWTWLRHLPEEDLQEFLDDVRQAIIVAAREETLTVLEETLQDWRVTAGQLADSQRRAILLGEHREEDFVEVARPGAPTA